MIRDIAIGIDQLLNTLIGGAPDETLSAHAYRMEQQRKPWGVMRTVIDFIFGQGHCEASFISECERRQSPEEER